MDKNGIAKRYAVAIYDIAKSMSNIEEIRESEFDCKNSAIKIGVTAHGKNANIYHLMVNLNYKVKFMLNAQQVTKYNIKPQEK